MDRRLFPDVATLVESRQTRQAQQHGNSSSLRTFKVNDTLYVRDFTSSSSKWLPWTVVKVTGPLSYRVQLSSGETVHCHVDTIHPRHVSIQPVQPQHVSDNSTEFSCWTYPHLAPQLKLTTPANSLTVLYVDRLDIVLHLTVLGY